MDSDKNIVSPNTPSPSTGAAGDACTENKAAEPPQADAAATKTEQEAPAAEAKTEQEAPAAEDKTEQEAMAAEDKTEQEAPAAEDETEQEDLAVDAGSPRTESNPMMEQSISLFHNLAEQFLDALCDVWSDCDSLKEVYLKYKLSCVQAPASISAAARIKLVRAYHRSMSKYYMRCNEKDNSVFYEEDLLETNDLLRDIDFRNKWSDDLHPQTKENVWQYVLGLNQYANMYNLYSKVPGNMLRTIEGMASGIAGKIEKGELNLSDLNLQTLGQEVSQNIDMEELNTFASSMMQNQEDMKQMYSMLGSMMSQFNQPQPSSSSV